MSRVILAIVALLLASCSPALPPVPGDQARIISVSPAVTQLVRQLGHGDALVGRSAFCRKVDALPVVGDLAGANVEAIIRLQPTHMLFQATTAPPPAGVQTAAEQTGAACVGLAMDTLDDLHTAIDTMHDLLGGDLAVAERLHGQLHDAVEPAPSRNQSLLLVQPGPEFLVWGGRTWLGQVASAAGWNVVLPDSSWVSCSAERLVRLAPDLVVALAEAPGLDVTTLEALDQGAFMLGRIEVLQHEQLMVPGTHAGAVREALDQLGGATAYAGTASSGS